MVTGQLAYFLIRWSSVALHQQAAQHHPAFLFLVLQALCHKFVQSGAVGLNNFRRHIVFNRKMQLQHAAFAHFVELLRRRNVPGYIRREQERQQTFDARYCDTSTECPSTENTDSDCDSL